MGRCQARSVCGDELSGGRGVGAGGEQDLVLSLAERPGRPQHQGHSLGGQWVAPGGSVPGQGQEVETSGWWVGPGVACAGCEADAGWQGHHLCLQV